MIKTHPVPIPLYCVLLSPSAICAQTDDRFSGHGVVTTYYRACVSTGGLGWHGEYDFRKETNSSRWRGTAALELDTNNSNRTWRKYTISVPSSFTPPPGQIIKSHTESPEVKKKKHIFAEYPVFYSTRTSTNIKSHQWKMHSVPKKLTSSISSKKYTYTESI